jgi:signal transduction histidine kinase
MPDRLDDLTLAGVVHDLNNVFEAVAEASELLCEDPKWSKLGAALQRSVQHGSRIVRSLQEKGGATDLDRLLDQAEALATDFLLSSRGPEIEFVRRVQVGLQLRGVRGAWERVFLNLFLNAARMMPQGGRIEIEAEEVADGIVVHVLDNGPGISPRVLPKLFEPGFTTSPKHKGLGLHIVRSVVESLGGQVSAANREDNPGAVFRIDLPNEVQVAVVEQADASSLEG